MSAYNVVKTSLLACFMVAIAGCASTAPRTATQSPTQADALEGAPAASEATTSSGQAPSDYEWTMSDSSKQAQSAKTDPTPAASLHPQQATDGQHVIR